MLEISKIKNKSIEIIQSLKKRGINASDSISTVIKLNEQRIVNQQKLDSILAQSNQLANTIGQLAKEKNFQK